MTTDPLLSTLFAEASQQPLRATQPLVLCDLAKAWIVVRGKVDLFACKPAQDGVWGARQALFRVEERGLILAVASDTAAGTLLAIGSPDCEVLTVPFTSLQRALLSGEPKVVAMLEGWLVTLAAAVFKQQPPLAYTDVSPLTALTGREEAQAVVASEGVRWIWPDEGVTLPLGMEVPGDTGAGLFPVCRASWIELAAGVSGRVFGTSDLLMQADLSLALERFRHAAHSSILTALHNADEARRARLQQKSAFDTGALSCALQNLQEAVHRKAKTSERLRSGPAVFEAMQVVARALQIKLTMPAELSHGQSVPDPIRAIAKASSIRVRRVLLNGDWWHHAQEPLLCFRESDAAPVALVPSGVTAWALFEPSTGITSPLDADIAGTLQPVAYSLYRSFPREAIGLAGLLRFGMQRCQPELLLIGGLGLAGGLLALIMPVAISVIFNRIIPGAQRGQLLQITCILLAVATAAALLNYVRGRAVLRLQGKVDAVLQAALWDRLLSLPLPFFRQYSSGDLAQRSMGIAQIREVLTGSVITALLSAFFSVFSLALLFVYSVRLALIAVCLVATAVLVSVLTGLLQMRFRRDYLLQSGVIMSKLLQFMSGIGKFKVSSTEARAFRIWTEDFSEQRRISTQSRRIAIALNVFNVVFPLFCLGTIFLVNAHMPRGVAAGHMMTTGNFLAFLAAFAQLLAAALAVSATTSDLVSVGPIYRRLQPILQTLPEGTDAKSDPGRLSGRIEVSSVRFSYGLDSPLILRDVSLRIESGQSVAFVGSSGSGKSTLLRLLLGFETPDTGAVYFDGQDLANLDPQAVRRQIGVVLQSSKPVSGSVLENIIGSSPLTMDDAWEACRLAGLEEDVRRMPMGLHTNISDGGGGISGGQRQRLMIARAIVHRPRIVFFDEATSALDNRTQAIVNRSLTGLQATRIIIAHRLSTIEHVDRIFVLHKGSIVESGTYQELLQQDGLFTELVKRQMV